MDSRLKHTHKEQGQGLLEFAMVLPLLLLVLVGMIEFGRIFAIYSNLFNAAREGSRYGIVHPYDVSGIVNAAQQKISLVDPTDVQVSVAFDSGPGTTTKDSAGAQVGDRVVVTVYYDVEPMLSIFRPLMQNLYVETEAARTISSLGIGSMDDAPTAAATYTVEATMTPNGDPTGTPTSAVPTATATPVPDVAISIDTPVWAGDTTVSGTAQPGQSVLLRDIQDPSISLSTVVGQDGTFIFRLDVGLVAGHVIVVQGYGRSDWTIVEGQGTPTPTATVTQTPGPTPTPSTYYIALSPECGPAGVNTITVNGYQWTSLQGEKLQIYWESTKLLDQVPLATDGSFSEVISVSPPANGTYMVKAQWSKSTGVFATDTFVVACPSGPAPTPTPSYPNLVVESVAMVNEAPISTRDPLTFTVAVKNVGETAANNLFWVDLYVDPANPVSPTQPLIEESADWAAVSSLEAGASMTLTLHHPGDFETTGEHVAYALVDTWNQVAESSELDNVSEPLYFTLSLTGTAPTPTPTPVVMEDGQIGGSTWLYVYGDVVPQGRVNVYCYDGDALISQALSDQNGDYLLENVPPGTYTVIGEATINGTLYTDIVADVIVYDGQITPYVTLILH